MHVMKFRNRNQKWSDVDVDILVRLMREHVPRPTIAAVLGRTEASLRHAIKNTLYQQLLHHMPSDVLLYYDMQDDVLYNQVVNPVYYKHLSESKTHSEVSKDNENTEESESVDESVSSSDDEGDMDESQSLKPSEACDYITSSILSVVLAAGVAFYVHIACTNWTSLQG